MAHLKSVPQEFIQNVFQAPVGVLVSTKAEQIVGKNNLSFAELISPFSKLNNEASLRDHAGNITPIKNLQLSITNLEQNPLPTNIARKLLNYVVSSASEQPLIDVQLVQNSTPIQIQIPECTPWFEQWRDMFLKVQYPADHEFTRHILACMLIVSSDELNTLATVEELNNKLTQMQNSATPLQFSKFFSSNILRYYIVLHDSESSSIASARETYDRLKNIYGNDNCFLLQINSRNSETNEPPVTTNAWLPFINLYNYPSEFELENGIQTPTPTAPAPIPSVSTSDNTIIIDTNEIDNSTNVHFHPLSPSSEECSTSSIQDHITHIDDASSHLTSSSTSLCYGAFMTSHDLEQLHRLIQEFCIKALIPHVECEIQRLTDIVANRKGVSRSLFNATKRWFVSNKPGNAAVSTVITKTYNSEDTEVQLRKLADLYFMFGNYPMAYQAYSAAKRDFYAEQAWQYYAGALEMAALSSFLIGEFTKKTCDYMEEAVNIYLTTCRLPQFATRATLLSAECLRGMQWWGDEAKQLIRMTSEDSDLRSALLLEQSAYCFLNCKPAMGRKYAFHIVLAGHRYSKAGQRKHTYRCYQQAAQIYNSRQWSLAEDHINYTLGRQAAYLNYTEKAAESFSKLLSTYSQQNSIQQSTFFKEMLSCFMDIQQKNPSFLLNLPVPIINGDDIKVALLATAPISAPERVPAASFVLQSNLNNTLNTATFQKLEELCVHEALNGLPLTFRPSTTVYSNETNNTVKPICVAGETIAVIVKLLNPLKVPITLRDIRLVCQFISQVDGVEYTTTILHDNDKSSSSPPPPVHTVPIPSVQLRVENTCELTLYVTPMVAGELHIQGILFALCSTTNDQQLTTNTSITQGRIDFYIPPRKQKRKMNTKAIFVNDYRLHIQVVSDAPCLQTTFSRMDTELLTGEIELVKVEMLNSGNCTMTNIHFATSVPHLINYELPTVKLTDKQMETLSLKDMHRKQFVQKVQSPLDTLQPGKKISFNLYLNAPNQKGQYQIDWLVYYQNSSNLPKYRLVKNIWEFTVTESLVPYLQSELSESSNNNGTEMNISVILTNPVHPMYTGSTVIKPLQAFLVSKYWILGSKCYGYNNDGMSLKETQEYYLNAFRSSNNKNQCQVTKIDLSKLLSKTLTQSLLNTVNHFIRICDNKIVKCTGDVEENLINQPVQLVLDENDDVSPILSTNNNSSINQNRLNAPAPEGTLAILWQATITDQNGVARNGYGFIRIPMDRTPHLVEDDEIFTEPLGVFRFSKSDIALEEINRRHEMAELEQKQKRLKYHIKCSQSVIEHDFNTSMICIVSLTIHLTNLHDQILNAKIELIDQSYSHKKKLLHKWIGCTKPLQCKLNPFSGHSFSLQIAFTTYGLFDLSHYFEVYCAPDVIDSTSTATSINTSSSTHKIKFTLQTYRRVEIISITPIKTSSDI